MQKVHTANGIFPGTSLVGKESYARLYHYTSLDSFKKIWENQTLKFGIISQLNDINECSKRISTPLSYGEIKDIGQRVRISAQIVNSYKQISLTKDYDSYIKGCMSPMMWGHYGDKRKGVCIELDFDKIHFENGMHYKSVKYSDLIKYSIEIPAEFNNQEMIEKHIIKEIDNIFFTKTSDWRGENEFRIISATHDFLDIENAITNVYVTEYDSNTCLELEKIVNNIVPVKFIHYIMAEEWRLPILTETKITREQELKALNDPNNILNHI